MTVASSSACYGFMGKIQSDFLEQFDPETKLPLSSEQLIPIVRRIAGDRLILSFSGRDSLAAWLFLRDKFELIPYFCYTVPHLSYDDEMLDYYERFFGCHIMRFPHPALYRLLRAGAWMPPDAASIIWHCDLPLFDYAFIEAELAKDYKLGKDYLTVVGIKAADNMQRLRLIRQMGPIGLKHRRYYYAIHDFKTADVRNIIQQAGCKLSKSYLYWGSTGDGIDYNFLRYLKDNLPGDFEKVLQLFPMADIELFRYEAVQ